MKKLFVLLLAAVFVVLPARKATASAPNHAQRWQQYHGRGSGSRNRFLGFPRFSRRRAILADIGYRAGIVFRVSPCKAMVRWQDTLGCLPCSERPSGNVTRRVAPCRGP